MKKVKQNISIKFIGRDKLHMVFRTDDNRLVAFLIMKVLEDTGTPMRAKDIWKTVSEKYNRNFSRVKYVFYQMKKHGLITEIREYFTGTKFYVLTEDLPKFKSTLITNVAGRRFIEAIESKMAKPVKADGDELDVEEDLDEEEFNEEDFDE